MRIGIFDSGIGGLLITKEIIRSLPAYDYIYLGDTARAPYGNRNPAEIENFLRAAIEFLFAKNCALVIVACNTASAQALRAIQQNLLLSRAPDRRVLGVLVPAVEATIEAGAKIVGVLGTATTVATGAFTREFVKRAPQIKVFEQAAPLLVTMIENDNLKNVSKIIREYLAPLLTQKIDTLILGCTHYPLLSEEFNRVAGADIKIISQNEVVPKKLSDYLRRHPEINARLTKNHTQKIFVTKITPAFAERAAAWFGAAVNLRETVL